MKRNRYTKMSKCECVWSPSWQENCGIFRFLAGFTLIAGVVLVTKPPLLFPSAEEEETYDVIGNFNHKQNILSIILVFGPLLHRLAPP
jgi:hypothetical protein